MAQGVVRNKSSVNDYFQRKEAMKLMNERHGPDFSVSGETSSNLSHFTFVEEDYFSDDENASKFPLRNSDTVMGETENQQSITTDKFINVTLREESEQSVPKIRVILQSADNMKTEETKRTQYSVNRMRGNLNIFIPWCEAEEQILKKEV